MLTVTKSSQIVTYAIHRNHRTKNCKINEVTPQHPNLSLVPSEKWIYLHAKLYGIWIL